MRKKIFTSLLLCSIMLTSCAQQTFVHSENNNQYRESSVFFKSDIPIDFFPEKYTIVSLGDSLTEGVGDSTKRGGYLPYLEAHLEQEKGISDAVFYNFGVRGNKTSQLLKRLKKADVTEAVEQADMVIVTIGGNDVMKVVRENFTKLDLKVFDKQKEIYAENLSTILDTIRKHNPNTTIVLIGLYNPFLKWFADVREIDIVMESWNQTSTAILSEYNHTHFVDIADIFKSTEENLLYTDFFHPNDKGYELIAFRVFDMIKNHALPTLSEQKYVLRKERGDL